MYTNFEVIRGENGTNTVEVECVRCGNKIGVSFSDLEITKLRDYLNGKCNIELALSNHSPDERELFISGICSDCWDKMFSDDNEDD